jgi:hypothetical protein
MSAIVLLLSLLGHHAHCFGFHDPHALERVRPLLAGNAGQSEHGGEDVVIKPGCATEAGTPLGRDRNKDIGGREVVGPDFDARIV